MLAVPDHAQVYLEGFGERLDKDARVAIRNMMRSVYVSQRGQFVALAIGKGICQFSNHSMAEGVCHEAKAPVSKKSADKKSADKKSADKQQDKDKKTSN